MVNKRIQNAVLGCNLKNDRMISVRFQGKPFNITVIQAYGPTSNTEEAGIEQFYEDLQDFLELTPPPKKKMDDMMAIINCSLFLMPSIDTKVDNTGLLDLIIFIIFKYTISVVLKILIALSPLLPPISRKFSSSQTETPYILNDNSPFSPLPPIPVPQPLATSVLLPVVMNLIASGARCKCDRIIFCPFVSDLFHLA